MKLDTIPKGKNKEKNAVSQPVPPGCKSTTFYFIKFLVLTLIFILFIFLGEPFLAAPARRSGLPMR